MIKKFFRDGLIYTIPALLNRGLSIVLVPLYTRVLSPTDYGLFDMLMVFGSLVNLTVTLEISQGVARFYTIEKKRETKIEYASTAFWFTLLSGTSFFAFAIALSPVLSVFIFGETGLEAIFRLGMVYVWANGIFYFVQNQFRWELCSKKYMISGVLVTLTTAFLAVFFAYALGWGLQGLLLGMLGGTLSGCVYCIYNLRIFFRWVFRKERLKEMLFFSLPFVPSGIAVLVGNYIDRFMINHFLSLGELGIYGIGFRLSSIVGLVMVGFQGALTPLIYANCNDPNTPRQLAVIFRTFCFFALMLFLGLVTFAQEILWLFTTPEYYSAARVVIFLVPAILISNMYIFAPGIGIAKKTHLILWVNVFGALMNTCLNYFLIPLFGIQGAGAATLLGYIFVFSSYMFFSQKLYPVRHNWVLLGKALLVVFGGILVGKSLNFNVVPNILLKSILGLTVAVTLLKIELITREELSKATQAIRGRLLRSRSDS